MIAGANIYIDAVLADPDEVVLESPDQTFGLRNQATHEILVPSGTYMDATSESGVYQYDFTETSLDQIYEYYVRYTVGSTNYYLYYTLVGTTSGATLDAYATLAEFNTYIINNILEEVDYTDDQKTKALNKATLILDRLNWLDEPVGTDHAWPRYDEVTVPSSIKDATILMALDLLNGVDPDKEFELLSTTSTSFGSAKVNYSREQIPRYILAGITSVKVWRLIIPYLVDTNQIKTVRVS